MSRRPQVTPSPHRFLAGKQRSPSPTNDVRPGSSFRKDVTPASTWTARSNPQLSTSSQFAATPRFSFGKSKPATRDQRSPSPPKPAAIQSFRSTARPHDDVDDAPDADEDDEMLDDGHDSIVPTTEHVTEDAVGDQHWVNGIAFSPKRRRLDEGNSILSPTRPTFKYPGTPASDMSRATPFHAHFERDSTQPSAVSNAPPLHRPAFIRPSTEPQEQNEPLPETFSPHKKGQKFVPGGMAATVQQWVIETGQAAVQSRKGQGYLKGEDYVMRAKVESFAGDSPFTVHATLPNGEAVNAILAPNRLPNAARSQELTEGCVVGVRAPTWEIELDGRVWTVGVDWRIL